MDEQRLTRAIEAIDALHADDPERVVVGATPIAAELLYAQRMSEALLWVIDRPSDALRIAVRAQHLCRWTIPRASYPEGRAGYHAWRQAEAKMHAERAAEVLRACGYDDAFVGRVEEIVRKRNLGHDPEAQALEDAACLVFLAHHAEAFAAGRDEESLLTIVRKTWAKMSERGRAEALRLELAPSVRALIERALG